MTTNETTWTALFNGQFRDPGILPDNYDFQNEGEKSRVIAYRTDIWIKSSFNRLISSNNFTFKLVNSVFAVLCAATFPLSIPIGYIVMRTLAKNEVNQELASRRIKVLKSAIGKRSTLPSVSRDLKTPEQHLEERFKHQHPEFLSVIEENKRLFGKKFLSRIKPTIVASNQIENEMTNKTTELDKWKRIKSGDTFAPKPSAYETEIASEFAKEFKTCCNETTTVSNINEKFKLNYKNRTERTKIPEFSISENEDCYKDNILQKYFVDCIDRRCIQNVTINDQTLKNEKYDINNAIKLTNELIKFIEINFNEKTIEQKVKMFKFVQYCTTQVTSNFAGIINKEAEKKKYFLVQNSLVQLSEFKFNNRKIEVEYNLKSDIKHINKIMAVGIDDIQKPTSKMEIKVKIILDVEEFISSNDLNNFKEQVSIKWAQPIAVEDDPDPSSSASTSPSSASPLVSPTNSDDSDNEENPYDLYLKKRLHYISNKEFAGDTKLPIDEINRWDLRDARKIKEKLFLKVNDDSLKTINSNFDKSDTTVKMLLKRFKEFEQDKRLNNILIASPSAKKEFSADQLKTIELLQETLANSEIN